MLRFLALSVLTLTACGNGAETEKAQAAVTALLRDPESAQFRNLEFNENGFVCGEVNARNSFGGMVGFQPFAAADGNAVIYNGMNSNDVRVVIINNCSAQFDQLVESLRKSYEDEQLR